MLTRQSLGHPILQYSRLTSIELLLHMIFIKFSTGLMYFKFACDNNLHKKYNSTSSSCYVDSFSGLSNFDCPFGIL